jgi:hypothetical protein
MDDDAPNFHIHRDGRLQPPSRLYLAWQKASREKPSSALVRQLQHALGFPGHAVDRHFVYLQLVEITYKLRADPAMLELCEKYCREQIALFPTYARTLAREIGGMPQVPMFQRLAIILERQGKFDEAISVCEQAMSYGLEDGTKGGFQGRADKLRRKKAERGL